MVERTEALEAVAEAARQHHSHHRVSGHLDGKPVTLDTCQCSKWAGDCSVLVALDALDGCRE